MITSRNFFSVGYDGPHCETELDPCNDFCPPGTNCVIMNGEPACQCDRGEMFVRQTQSCKGKIYDGEITVVVQTL